MKRLEILPRSIALLRLLTLSNNMVPRLIGFIYEKIAVHFPKGKKKGKQSDVLTSSFGHEKRARVDLL